MKIPRGLRWTGLVLAVLGTGYLGLKLYGQYRTVPVYVLQFSPMTVKWDKTFREARHQPPRARMQNVPYAEASAKMLAPAELARVRAALAWSGPGLNWVDVIHIQGPTTVWADKKTGLGQGRYYLIRYESGWRKE